MTEQQIGQKIDRAAQGRLIWLELKEKCAFDEDTFVILFPQAGTMCNAYVMQYLPAFIKKTGAGRLVLLSHDEKVLNEGPDTDIRIQTQFLSREDAQKIMDYYTLQMFTDKLVIASLEEPEGRSGGNLIGVKHITEEETVAIGIVGRSGVGTK